MEPEPEAPIVHAAVSPDGTDSPEAALAIESATRFLMTLFQPGDWVLFRPIEAWTQNGKKDSRVIYQLEHSRQCDPEVFQFTIRSYLRTTPEFRANVFFGVCPRLGGKGEFDLAWQIRTARAVWSDIDHVTVKEALERCTTAKLPTPSIVVNSGNGVHLYWLLDTPYSIDDCDPPPQVVLRFDTLPNGRKKAHRFIWEDGERVPIERVRSAERMSAKANRLQDIIAGVGKAIGGDHTHDLSRLLRIPGFLNRKNEKNGAVPRPTELVECDSTRRYPISLFEPFAIPSPEAQKQKQIASIPLPRVRRLSASKADKLDELIAASAMAAAGTRSEVDFRLCCFAIQSGASQEEVWSKVATIGKFAERGRPYFDRTWESAADKVRDSSYERIQKTLPAAPAASVGDSDPNAGADHTRPDGGAAGPASDRRIIHVDTSYMQVDSAMQQITDQFLKIGGCYTRADQFAVVRGNAIRTILTTAELLGVLNKHLEFYFVDSDGEGGEFRPLPPAYANTWLNRDDLLGKLPKITMFTNNPVFAPDWKLVEPGYNASSGIYYSGAPIAPREGREYLDRLLADFCFKAPADRANYIAMLLTAVCVPHFIGAKPAALFNGNQPGIGKSILAQIIAILRDGHTVGTISYNPNDEEFEKRFGSVVRRGVTTLIIDNAKLRGRNQRIDSACLERSITDAILSFRLLGSSQDIQAENSHIFCLTANSADISPDLISRSVPINLFFEGAPSRRKFSLPNPERYVTEHRVEILGELVGMVEKWKEAGSPRTETASRFNKSGWGDILGGILSVAEIPDFLANIDEMAESLDETRRDFTELVTAMLADPRGAWTGATLVELAGQRGLLTNELGDGSARSQAIRLGLIASRYVGEYFDVDVRRVRFQREKSRTGQTYRVELIEGSPKSAECLSVCGMIANDGFFNIQHT